MIVGVIVTVLMYKRKSDRLAFQADMDRAELAVERLRQHTQALDEFMFTPGVAENLKRFLMAASEAIESREFARFMAAKLTSGTAVDGDTALLYDLQELSVNNSAAYDVFIEALFAGLTAAFLRWPETASVVSIPVAPTQDYIKREVAATDKAIRERTYRGSMSDDLVPA